MTQLNPAPEWTNQQKFQNLHKHDSVLIRFVRGPNQAPEWAPARIVSVPHKGGAECRIQSSGAERFFHWSEIIPADDFRERPKPITTLGELVAAKQEGASIVQMRNPQPTPPRLGALLVSKNELARLETKRAQTVDWNKYRSFGELIRELRMAKGMKQLDLSIKLSELKKQRFHQSDVSHHERDEIIPNDDQLLLYAQALDIDLRELIKLRDRTQRQPRKKTEKVVAKPTRYTKPRSPTQPGHPSVTADPPTELGRRLRELRLTKNWSQQTLSEELRKILPNFDLTNKHVSRYELGHVPEAEVFAALDKVFRLTDKQAAELRSLVLQPGTPGTIRFRREEPPAPRSAPTPAPVAPQSSTGDFVSFIQQLAGLVPMPADKAGQAEWLRNAGDLFNRRGG